MFCASGMMLWSDLSLAGEAFPGAHEASQTVHPSLRSLPALVPHGAISPQLGAELGASFLDISGEV